MSILDMYVIGCICLHANCPSLDSKHTGKATSETPVPVSKKQAGSGPPRAAGIVDSSYVVHRLHAQTL